MISLKTKNKNQFPQSFLGRSPLSFVEDPDYFVGEGLGVRLYGMLLELHPQQQRVNLPGFFPITILSLNSNYGDGETNQDDEWFVRHEPRRRGNYGEGETNYDHEWFVRHEPWAKKV